MAASGIIRSLFRADADSCGSFFHSSAARIRSRFRSPELFPRALSLAAGIERREPRAPAPRAPALSADAGSRGTASAGIDPCFHWLYIAKVPDRRFFTGDSEAGCELSADSAETRLACAASARDWRSASASDQFSPSATISSPTGRISISFGSSIRSADSASTKPRASTRASSQMSPVS